MKKDRGFDSLSVAGCEKAHKYQIKATKYVVECIFRPVPSFLLQMRYFLLIMCLHGREGKRNTIYLCELESSF